MISIKRLTVDDLNERFAETLSALAPTKYTSSMSEVFAKREAAGIITIVAFDDNKIVGTASLIIENKFIHDGSKVAHVEDVAVHPEYQGKGIGLTMMSSLELFAKLEGVYKIILDCSEENVPFYEKFGFFKKEVQMRKNLS